MSPIKFYFELDAGKPDEERAMQLLHEWQRNGWDMQKTIVMALLSLDKTGSDFMSGGSTPESPSNHSPLNEKAALTLDEAIRVLHEAQNLMEKMQGMSSRGIPETGQKQEAVSNSFVASMRKVIKPGISSNDL
ncbi:MAG TPA: hypothetical protein VJZ27_20655 [Aggregatilineales bacterium]|nr:hypothetical protein [Aggregatilineales bacterium]